MCLGSFKFWKKRQKQPSTHLRPSPIAQRASPEPNIAPLTATASAPCKSSLDLAQSPKTNLQEKLWDQAYHELQEQEPGLVKVYEELIPSRAGYQDDPRIVGMSPQEKWDQMRKAAEDGLNRTQRSTEVQDTINNLFDMAMPVKGMIDKIMPVVPQAQVPWLAVSLTFEIFSKPFKEPGINRTGLLYVTTKIQEYMNLSDYIVDDEGRQSDMHHKLEKDTVELYRKLLFYQIKSICCFHKHGLKRFVRNAFLVDDWSGQLNDIKAAEALVWEDVNKFQNQVMVDHFRKQSSDAQNRFNTLKEISLGIHRFIREQQETSYEKDNKSCRQHLKQTDPSLDRERILSAKGTLLRESYSWVIEHPQFQDWKANPSHRRLWIRGDAGKGKTMLLCGIIEELEKDPFSRLCYFFCQATDENLRDGRCVLRGLLFYLIKQYPWLISHVREDYDDSGEKLFNDHNAWQALQKISKSVLNDEGLDEVIIIVDALDECMVHREELLKFICDISANSRAKLIVSSRPFVTIQKALQHDGKSSSTLTLGLNDELISDAVKRFINSRVKDLEKDRPYRNDPDICKKVTKHLTDNAESTFLWVALVCKELSSRTVCRKEHVFAILNNSPPGLNNLYDRMLESICNESRDFEICLEILATNSVVKRPVTVAELSCILDPKIASEMDALELEQIIMSCGSFLHLQKGVVYFIHQSAVDFLSEDRASRFPRITDRHRYVFRNALHTLQVSPVLKRDIYNLEDPSVAKKDIKTPEPDPLLHVYYSCIHWVDHLQDHLLLDVEEGRFGSVTSEDSSLIFEFLKRKFLFWLEALSLLRDIPQAIKSMQKLQKLLSNSADEPTKDFVLDANRFLMYHIEAIEEYPLQLYAGCLVFSPKDSIVKHWFQSEAPKWVTVAPGLDSTWDTCLQTLVQHQDEVLSVAYSPDDQWFISGSSDSTVKLWDSESGTCIHTCETQSLWPVSHVAFLPDGKSFVSVAISKTVAIWDRFTGNLISEHQPTLSMVNGIAISSDTYTVAYVLRKNFILIWNRRNEVSSRTFSCPEGTSMLALSPDGQWLVTAVSKDRKFVTWNTLNGDKMETCTDYEVCTAIWSTDGRLFATGGQYGSVEIWKRSAGQWISKMKAQRKSDDRNEIRYMALSTDKTLLAAGYIYDISVWNTDTGVLMWAVDVTRGVNSVSISSDNSRLVSALMSDAIKVWDISKAHDGRLGPCSVPAQHLCWSDAGHIAVYFSDRDEIRIYGTNTLRKMYAKGVSAMAISHDNRRLASASSESKEITIWDMQTGEVLGRLDDSKEAVFSEYEQSRSAQKYERQNSDHETAEPMSIQTTKSLDGLPTKTLTFSSAYQLASSDSGLIKIWDTSDGRCLQTLGFGEGWARLIMAFSKTGRWLAVLSSDLSSPESLIKLWDTVTWECITITPWSFTLHGIEALTFSADSQQLATNAEYGWTPVIQIWHVRSGDTLRSIPIGDYRGDVRFDSKNERLLYTQYGSYDTTIDTEEVYQSPLLYTESESLNTTTDTEEVVQSPRGYGLVQNSCKDWIMLDGKAVLWIPESYRVHRLEKASPVIDGSRIIWTRGSETPVQLFFNSPDCDLAGA